MMDILAIIKISKEYSQSALLKMWTVLNEFPAPPLQTLAQCCIFTDNSIVSFHSKDFMSEAPLLPWSHTEGSHCRTTAATLLHFHFSCLSRFICSKKFCLCENCRKSDIYQLPQKESYFIFYHSAGLDWWPKILEFQLPGENKYSVEDI